MNQTQIDLIQSHYKCMETYSKLGPQNQIDVEDLAYEVKFLKAKTTTQNN